MMKVGIVGIGAVGAATAMAVVLRARVRELILIDRNRARAPRQLRPTCITGCRFHLW
jgi:malate/lactate dehydrogenase